MSQASCGHALGFAAPEKSIKPTTSIDLVFYSPVDIRACKEVPE